MFAISHCALILVNSNRESCNVRLTAATHIRTYTINNTHTSSTDSKQQKKGKKIHHFFITIQKKHVIASLSGKNMWYISKFRFYFNLPSESYER